MTEALLTQQEAFELVKQYREQEHKALSTEDILSQFDVLKECSIQKGKVSDSVYETNEGNQLVDKNGNPVRLLFRSDRISTHDVKRGQIPFKAQILAINHNFMRKKVENILGTSQYEIEGLELNSLVIAAENLDPLDFENVVRAYACKSSTVTSLYVNYFKKGEKEFCGHKLPDDLKPNYRLPDVIATPSTKEKNDESVSLDYLAEHGNFDREIYKKAMDDAVKAFNVIADYLLTKGIILGDTKTEHGLNSKGELVSMDELYTMDSSRFWLKADYDCQKKLLEEGKTDELLDYLYETQGISRDEYEKKYMEGHEYIIVPQSFSKEFARGFSKGKKGYTDDVADQIAVQYIMGIQHLTGQRFMPDTRPMHEAIIEDTRTIINELGIMPKSEYDKLQN